MGFVFAYRGRFCATATEKEANDIALSRVASSLKILSIYATCFTARTCSILFLTP